MPGKWGRAVFIFIVIFIQSSFARYFFVHSFICFLCLCPHFVFIAGNIVSITYQPIFRPEQNDWGVKLGEEISLPAQEHKFDLQSEFVRVQLGTSDGAKHVEYHAQIIPKAPEQAKSKAGLQLSVVIIGFDSLSAVHFQRALPEVYKFMKDELNSLFLNGYSIVGDGTTPALTALMTGQ